MPDPVPRENRRWRRGTLVMLRRTLSHAGTIVVYTINLGLVALGAVFIYLALREDLPVPGFLHGRIQQELAARGFDARFTAAKFDPSGRIYIEQAALVPTRYGEPVLSAERVFVQFDRLKLLAGRVDLTRLDAEEVRVICPSGISPSGVPMTLVRIASVRAEQRGGVWSVPGLLAEIGPLHLTARGSYTPLRGRPPGAAPDVAALLEHFNTHAPRLTRLLMDTAGFSEPRLAVEFSGAAGQPWTIAADLSVAAWSDVRFGELRGARLHTLVTLAPESRDPVRVTAHVDSFERANAGRMENISLMAEWLTLPTAERPWPWQVHAGAARFVHAKATVENPVIALFPLAFPLIEVNVAGTFEGHPLAVRAVGDARMRAGDVWVQANPGPTWLPRVTEIIGRDVEKYAVITAPPDGTVHVVVAPNLQWQRADFRLLSGPLLARGVPLERMRIAGTVTPAGLEVGHLEFSREGEEVRGTYQSDFTGRDYRFRLAGAARPLSISPWLGPWWGRFWQDYTFAGAVPRFEVDAQGNWLRPEPILISGFGAADKVSFRGVAFDAVQSNFFIRPSYFDLFNAKLVRPEGRLDGGLQMRIPRGESTPVWQQFDFQSTADLVEISRVFGPGGEAWLAPYRYQRPPAVTAHGTITKEAAGRFDVRLDLGIETSDEFRYHDFPLDSLSTRVRIHNRRVEIPGIQAGYADGLLSGVATVEDGIINFDARLANADFDRAVKIYSEFSDRNFPTPVEAAAEDGGFTREGYGGRLTFQIAAHGPLTDFKAYEGTGSVAITGADLYQFKVIGVFGDLFDRIGINVGRLDFTDAAGLMEIRRDTVHFPDLRVTGRTGRLEASGDYSLRDRNIDFRVRMKPLKETSGFLTQIVGAVLNPLSDMLFEARLSGTLRNPEKRIVFFASRRTETPARDPVVPERTGPLPAPDPPVPALPPPAAPTGEPTPEPAS